MNCHDARELFSALIDETLTREERADVYGHLATCAECRRELAAIERTVALVRGAAPVRAPAGFVDRVVHAARPIPWYARAARGALLPWPVKVPLGAAAVLLVAGLAVLMFRGMQEQQRAAHYETQGPVFQDRMAPPSPAPEATPPAPPPPTAPAETPAAPPPAVPSSDRAVSAPERDRPAAEASRVDEAKKRAEMEQREAAPAEKLGDARAAAPTMQSSPPATGETAVAKREAPRAMATARPDVIARLAAPDRDTAERALAALAARLAGAVTGRRVDGDTTVVELIIPRERYADFTREVARLGAFRIDSEAPAPPDSIRIVIVLAS